MFVFYNQTQALEQIVLEFLSRERSVEYIDTSDAIATVKLDDTLLHIAHISPWLVISVVRPDASIDCISVKPANYVKPIRHRQATVHSFEQLQSYVHSNALSSLLTTLDVRLFHCPPLITVLSSSAMHTMLTFLDHKSISRVFQSCKRLNDIDTPSFWRCLYLTHRSMPVFRPHLISWKSLVLMPN